MGGGSLRTAFAAVARARCRRALAVEHPAHDRERLAEPAQPLREARRRTGGRRPRARSRTRRHRCRGSPGRPRCGRASSPSWRSGPARGTCSPRPSGRSGSARSPGPRPQASASPRGSARRRCRRSGRGGPRSTACRTRAGRRALAGLEEGRPVRVLVPAQRTKPNVSHRGQPFRAPARAEAFRGPARRNGTMTGRAHDGRPSAASKRRCGRWPSSISSLPSAPNRSPAGTRTAPGAQGSCSRTPPTPRPSCRQPAPSTKACGSTVTGTRSRNPGTRAISMILMIGMGKTLRLAAGKGRSRRLVDHPAPSRAARATAVLPGMDGRVIHQRRALAPLGSGFVTGHAVYVSASTPRTDCGG